jgi:hypothetical protein
MLGIDFETVGLTPERGKLRLIQTANGSGPRVLDAWDLADDVDKVLAALVKKELVAHNASFEFRDTDEGPESPVWVAVWELRMSRLEER